MVVDPQRYWHTHRRLISQTIAREAAKPFIAQVTAISGAKYQIKRPENTSPDGTYYPCISPTYKPLVNDWVRCLGISGGVIILCRDQQSTDKDIPALDLQKFDKAGGTITGDSKLVTSTPSLDMQDTSATDPNDYARLEKVGDEFRVTVFDNSANAFRTLLKVNVATNAVTIFQDPANPLEVSTKQYADLKLPKTGGTLTGVLTLAADPASNLQAATKQYADNSSSGKLPLTGGTMSGAITLSGAPTVNLHPATKLYTDTGDAAQVSKAGDTMSGALTLNANPVNALHAATKQYTDSAASNAASNKLDLTSGGTVQGIQYNTHLHEWWTCGNTGIGANSGISFSTSGGRVKVLQATGIASGTDGWPMLNTHDGNVYVYVNSPDSFAIWNLRTNSETIHARLWDEAY